MSKTSLASCKFVCLCERFCKFKFWIKLLLQLTLFLLLLQQSSLTEILYLFCFNIFGPFSFEAVAVAQAEKVSDDFFCLQLFLFALFFLILLLYDSIFSWFLFTSIASPN